MEKWLNIFSGIFPIRVCIPSNFLVFNCSVLPDARRMAKAALTCRNSPFSNTIVCLIINTYLNSLNFTFWLSIDITNMPFHILLWTVNHTGLSGTLKTILLSTLIVCKHLCQYFGQITVFKVNIKMVDQ